MPRPQPPRRPPGPGPPPRSVPRPQPDSGRNLADHGHPVAGESYLRLSEDGRGPGRGGHPQPRRPGARRRPRQPAARLRTLERPVADQPEVPVASRRAAGPGVLGASDRAGRALADLAPRPGPRDQRLPRPPCRGGRPQGPDRRPIRRRPLGRDLQPGHVSTDGADPVDPRRSAGDGPFPRGRRRADRARRKTSPAARWPARSCRPG